MAIGVIIGIVIIIIRAIMYSGSSGQTSRPGNGYHVNDDTFGRHGYTDTNHNTFTDGVFTSANSVQDTYPTNDNNTPDFSHQPDSSSFSGPDNTPYDSGSFGGSTDSGSTSSADGTC